MSYFATSDNCKLYYEDLGSGKPVIFIHGWSANRHYFRNQIPAFREKHRVISYDLRGHGDSQVTEYGLTLPRCAQDLKELIEYLGLEDVALVGWSMGAHVIYEYVRQFGCEHIGKLCWIDMSPKMITDDEWKWGIFGSYTQNDLIGFLSAIATDWDAVVDGLVPSCYAKNAPPPADEVAWALKQVRKNTPHVMLNMWMAIAIQDYRDVFPKITVPTLITYGIESLSFDAANSKYQSTVVKNSRVVGFENCGHSLIVEDPEKFNREVLAFLAE
jgi:pimeloyl-ACP methyl ester carboxylesterase